MGVIEADLIEETGGDSLSDGALVITLTQVWRAKTDSDSDGPLTVRASAMLPATGSTAVSPDGITVYVTGKSCKREAGVNSKRVWLVTVTYTSETGTQEFSMPVNDNGQHVQDPTQAAQEVELVYQTEYVPAETAKFLRVVRYNATLGTFTEQTAMPDLVGYRGPIVNSANEFGNEARKRKTILTLRVSRVVDTWNNSWNSLVNKTNNASLTITESDADGAAFSASYLPDELLFLYPQKQTMRVNGKLYYRATFVFLVDEDLTHRYRHPDFGLQRRLFLNQYKNIYTETDDQWTQAEIDDLPGISQKIEDASGEGHIMQPVKLNGYGQEMPKDRPGAYTMNDTYFLEYEIEGDGDYSIFGMT